MKLEISHKDYKAIKKAIVDSANEIPGNTAFERGIKKGMELVVKKYEEHLFSKAMYNAWCKAMEEDYDSNGNIIK